MNQTSKPLFTLEDLMKGPIYSGMSPVAKMAATISTAPDKNVFYVITRSHANAHRDGAVVSDAIKQETGSSKTYYVITRKYANRFLGLRGDRGLGPWKETPQEALKYQSVEDAVRFLVNIDSGSDARGISKITETPAGPSTIRLVSTRTLDATKPVVIFDGERGVYAAQGMYVPLNRRPGVLADARVFSDLNEALTVLQEQRLATVERRGVNRDLKIHQVEVIPGTPTVTETVLS